MQKEPKTGEKAEIKTSKGTYSGIVMERPSLSDKDHIVLKLDNGYNVGIKKADITDVKITGERPKHEKEEFTQARKNPKKPGISILATGGTIASRVDYITGGVHSAFRAEELISAVPELGSIANLSGRQVFNKFSENMGPRDWALMAKEIHSELKKKADGVVLTHGTDTMGYTAAALAFMLKTPVPVVITGAQRSSDRGSSDAALNLTNAAYVAANANLAEVCVVMHAETSDSFAFIHPATKVRKMHSSRRDAFRTINDKPLGIADIRNHKLELRAGARPRNSVKLELDSKIDENVSLVKFYPGMKPKIIDAVVSAGQRGIVIEGTGLGHVSEDIFASLESAISSGVNIAMTSQTLWGRVAMNVYSTGRKLIELGVIPCEDTLPETAYVKLVWVLGHTKKQEKVRDMMLTNYAGEITERTVIETGKKQFD